MNGRKREEEEMGVISISRRRRFLFGCGVWLGQSGRLLGAVIIIALTFTGSFGRGKEKKGKEWGMGSFWGESDDSILVEGGGQVFFSAQQNPTWSISFLQLPPKNIWARHPAAHIPCTLS